MRIPKLAACLNPSLFLSAPPVLCGRCSVRCTAIFLLPSPPPGVARFLISSFLVWFLLRVAVLVVWVLDALFVQKDRFLSCWVSFLEDSVLDSGVRVLQGWIFLLREHQPDFKLASCFVIPVKEIGSFLYWKVDVRNLDWVSEREIFRGPIWFWKRRWELGCVSLSFFRSLDVF